MPPNRMDNSRESLSNIDRSSIRATVLKKMSKTTVPLIVIGLISTAEDFFEMSFISKLGKEALAINALYNTSFSFLLTDNGLLNPLSYLIAEAHGKRQNLYVGHLVQQGWILSTALSLPTIAGLWAVEPLLNLLGQSATITYTIGQYARITSLGCLPLYWTIVDTTFLQSISKSYLVIPFILLSSGIGVFGSYTLILGNFGFPVLGILGPPWTMVIQNWITNIVLKIFLVLYPGFKPYGLFKCFCINAKILKKVFNVGMPLFIGALGEQLKYFVLGNMKGWLGTRQLALNQASNIFLQFLMPPIIGIRQGTQICIAQFRGKQDYISMRKVGLFGVLIEASLNIALLTAYTLFPIELAKYFLPDDNLDDLESFIRIVFVTKAINNLLQSLQGSLSENIKSLLKTRFPTIIQLISSLAIVLPLSYLMAFIFEMDLIGMNVASCIGAIFAIPFMAKKWHYTSHDVVNIDADLQNAPLINVSNIDAVEQNEPLLGLLPNQSGNIYTHNSMLRRKSEPDMRHRVPSHSVDYYPLYAAFSDHESRVNSSRLQRSKSENNIKKMFLPTVSSSSERTQTDLFFMSQSFNRNKIVLTNTENLLAKDGCSKPSNE